MKKSEKLLDAIGQIDDRLVEEVAKVSKTGTDAGIGKPGKKKRLMMYRLQGAIAACVMLAVCAGIVSLVQRKGASSDQSGAGQIMEEAAMDNGADAAAAEPADAGGEGLAAASGVKGTYMTTGEDGAQEKEDVQEVAELADDSLEEAMKETAGEEKMQDSRSSLQKGQGAEEKRNDGAPMVQSEDSGGVSGIVEESNALTVTYLIVNNGDRDIILLGEYALERLTEEEWRSVDPKAEVCWKDTEALVKAGDRYEKTVSLDKVYGELESGQYRLVKSYMLAAGKEPQGEEKYPLYMEFAVDR